MNFSDLFILAGLASLSGLVAYVFGHSKGWQKGFADCSSLHKPKADGGEQ